MKKRIQFKKKQEPPYKVKGSMLYCNGLPIQSFESPKLAKLSADRWNAKHERGEQILQKQNTI
jgi:hypothetical protein